MEFIFLLSKVNRSFFGIKLKPHKFGQIRCADTRRSARTNRLRNFVGMSCSLYIQWRRHAEAMLYQLLQIRRVSWNQSIKTLVTPQQDPNQRRPNKLHLNRSAGQILHTVRFCFSSTIFVYVFSFQNCFHGLILPVNRLQQHLVSNAGDKSTNQHLQHILYLCDLVRFCHCGLLGVFQFVSLQKEHGTNSTPTPWQIPCYKCQFWETHRACYVACIFSVDGPICSNRSLGHNLHLGDDGTRWNQQIAAPVLVQNGTLCAPSVLYCWTHYNSLALHVSDDAIFYHINVYASLQHLCSKMCAE